MLRSLPVRPLFVAAMLGTALAAAACSSGSTGSGAGPTGSQSPAAATPTGTTASTPAEPEVSTLVLGPVGIGALRLGMSEDQIAATGLVSKVNYLNATDDCGSASSHEPAGAYSLWVSRTKGLVAVVTYGPQAHTPEGIGKGATLTAVKGAYPTVKPSSSGGGDQYQAAVPSNAAAFYQFDMIGTTTSQMILALKTQTCFH